MQKVNFAYVLRYIYLYCVKKSNVVVFMLRNSNLLIVKLQDQAQQEIILCVYQNEGNRLEDEKAPSLNSE